MILVRQETWGPEQKAVWRQDELRASDLVMVRLRGHGAVRDEVFCPEVTPGCSSLRFILDGPAVLRLDDATVDLRVGQLYASAVHGSALARSLTPTTDQLVIGWRHGDVLGGSLEGDARLNLAPSARAALQELAARLSDRAAPRAHVAMAAGRALRALRAEGFPLAPDAHRVLDPEASVERSEVLGGALEDAMGALASHPTGIDLSQRLGVCEHHALRRMNRHLREFYFTVTNWRDYLRRRRIDLGTFFMGRADARTEEVARALGFRSPTSFCHAFQDAGTPAPRAVQRLLLAS